MTRVEENKKNSSAGLTEDKKDEKDEKKELGKRLKLAREKRGYTQKQIAAALGISDKGYQYYEYGTRTPKIDTMKKIAVLLETSIDELYGYGRYADDLEKGIEYVTYIYECYAYHRKRAGLTQRQVAAALGITEQAYQKYEYGKSAPDAKKMLKLYKIFGVGGSMMFAPWDKNPNRLRKDEDRRRIMNEDYKRFAKKYKKEQEKKKRDKKK